MLTPQCASTGAPLAAIIFPAQLDSVQQAFPGVLSASTVALFSKENHAAIAVSKSGGNPDVGSVDSLKHWMLGLPAVRPAREDRLALVIPVKYDGQHIILCN